MSDVYTEDLSEILGYARERGIVRDIAKNIGRIDELPAPEESEA